MHVSGSDVHSHTSRSRKTLLCLCQNSGSEMPCFCLPPKPNEKYISGEKCNACVTQIQGSKNSAMKGAPSPESEVPRFYLPPMCQMRCASLYKPTQFMLKKCPAVHAHNVQDQRYTSVHATKIQGQRYKQSLFTNETNTKCVDQLWKLRNCNNSKNLCMRAWCCEVKSLQICVQLSLHH